MIYLVGVHHQIQYLRLDGLSPTSENFKIFLNQFIKDNDIEVIAEELNEDALKNNGANKSLSQLIAYNYNINHIFCDPGHKQRKELGIPLREEIERKLYGDRKFFTSKEEGVIQKESEKYFPIRERYWFKKIEDYLEKNIIFICGKKHIRSFSGLLNGKGVAFEIVSDF